MGLPACPDHAERGTIFELLKATDRIGVSLTESFAMMPAAAVNGLYFARCGDAEWAPVGVPHEVGDDAPDRSVLCIDRQADLAVGRRSA